MTGSPPGAGGNSSGSTTSAVSCIAWPASHVAAKMRKAQRRVQIAESLEQRARRRAGRNRDVGHAQAGWGEANGPTTPIGRNDEDHEQRAQHKGTPNPQKQPSAIRHVHLLRPASSSCDLLIPDFSAFQRVTSVKTLRSRQSRRIGAAQKRAGSTYSPHSARNALQISPKVASALSAVNIGSIMFPSARATLIMSANAASTTA